jgi:hypothetical protein
MAEDLYRHFGVGSILQLVGFRPAVHGTHPIATTLQNNMKIPPSGKLRRLEHSTSSSYYTLDPIPRHPPTTQPSLSTPRNEMFRTTLFFVLILDTIFYTIWLLDISHVTNVYHLYNPITNTLGPVQVLVPGILFFLA